MKKALALLFIIITLLSMGACSNKMNDDIKDTNNNSSVNTSKTENNINEETNSNNVESGDVINITEKMYVTYINEIYTNATDYLGKTIKIQGMFTSEYCEPTKTTYYYVYRTGPGCCGNDGSMCGFEFTYKGDIPNKNEWIEVIGTLRTYEEEGNTYLTLDVCSLKVMDKSGAETVYR